MSVLSKIRNRAGLLVTIVGVALLVFILESALESSNFFFRSNSNNVGEIDGHGIGFQEFNQRVEEGKQNMMQSQQRSSLDDFMVDMIVNQTWNQYVNEYVMDKEVERSGVSVSNEEIYDMMVDHPHPQFVRNISDPQTGRVAPRFADPATGMISSVKLREFTQQMTAEEEASWIKLEEYLKKLRISEKYMNLIKKGMYVTGSQAKHEHLANNQTCNFKFVAKRYNSIADSTVKVDDNDIKNYYNDHLNDYKQAETVRKVEYVAFDITPTSEDIEAIKTDLSNLAVEFKKREAKEDSAFIVSEAATRSVDGKFYKKKSLPAEIDSLAFASEVGAVLGPYMDNNSFKIAKVMAKKTSADSAKVRHILIAYKGAQNAAPTIARTKEQAKHDADSLLKAIKSGAKFADIVAKHSDDPGKNKPADKKDDENYTGKGGDYGWVKETSSFVEPFKNAGLDGKKGDINVVESTFGYHIIEVLDSKGAQPMVKVGIIDRPIEPSAKTMQAANAKASEFSAKSTTTEMFVANAQEQKLPIRSADNLREGDRTLAGIDGSKEAVRWAYQAEKGNVSQAYIFGNKVVVATLTAIKEKGILPLEDVRQEVEVKAKQNKKAQQFINDMSGATSIDALAQKIGAPAEKAENINFNSQFVPGAGKEDALVGLATALKANTLSKPIQGNIGVYVVFVESVKDAGELKDAVSLKSSLSGQLANRVDNEVFEALKENANVTDHKAKFY